ncbi:IF44L-like protein [Mya arenaria]|uniref:IF44L-like protein n=1 Tax=Mya arenaria TaxID=6604 RepID=A0ABY7D9V8_MYAAR|nr:IF44L-like protein [Mya arenaria]
MFKSLTEKDFDVVESWIGTWPKTFNLLYGITRDGYDASVFHQKCDNQGPTLTVLYNKEGSVYGGYTGISWETATVNTNKKDDSAFLYQLYFSGKKATNQMLVKNGHTAISSVFGYGPIFGGYSSCDLLTFSGVKQRSSSGEYNLNGMTDPHFGKNYDIRGTLFKDVNNGHLNVIELEVYAVKDGQREKPALPTPWRKTATWGTKLLESLKDEVKGIQPPEGLDVPHFNILLIGPSDSGKSSFCNLVSSVFRGRISHRARVGGNSKSSTTTMDGSTVDDISKPMLHKLESYQNLFNRKVTKIDKLCEKTEENVNNTFISQTVKEAVEKVSELFKFPRNNIWPIKNYEEEVESDESINILALLAVRQILFFAEDYLETMNVKQSRRIQRGKAKQAESEVFGT